MLRILATLFCLTIALPAFATCKGPSQFDALPEDQQADLQRRAAQAPFAQGNFWQVEKNGVTSYVIGTMHLPDARHARILDTLKAIPNPPSRLFLELNSTDELVFQNHLTSDPSKILITSGPTLIERLGEDNWTKLKPRLADIGLPPFVAAKYQPWFLGLTLSIPACAVADIKAGRPGLDRQIEDWAEDKGLTAQSLDNTENLMRILASDPLEEQVEMLKWSLSQDFDLSGADSITTMLALYFEERNQLYWEYSKAEALGGFTDPADIKRVNDLFDELQSDLVQSRNLQWVDALAPALGEAPAFVAVGALHLPGENGVLTLLQNQGFSIKRVRLVHN
ncbi:TraB/GumN family protein [Shimia sp.]|uniref:TraB/GumN family protein n=1 Tax=Shimia sp. TaxID=1954381 RepID=UPI0032983FAD